MATRLRCISGTLALIAGLLIPAAHVPAAEPELILAPVEGLANQAALPEWQVEWDAVVAAARMEGKVVIAGSPGDSWRKAALEFQKAYPEIQVEYSGTPSGDELARIKSEREGNLYLRDVWTGGWTSVAEGLIDYLAPLRPAMILPEVLDDSKWLSGFDAGFMDEYTFAFSAYLVELVRVNREVAPKPQLATVEELLDPKWKGKIAWHDPRAPGAGRAIAAQLIAWYGEDFYRKLLAQDVTTNSDSRRLLEDLVRGRYAVALGVSAGFLTQLRQEGLLAEIEPLAGTSYVASGSGHVGLFDKAPHPNAAKVFINWLLSREGQRIHVEYLEVNSRRLDVDGPPATAAPPGYDYYCPMVLQQPYNQKVTEIAREILR